MSDDVKCGTGCITPSVCHAHYCNRVVPPTPDPRERDVCAWCDARVIHSPKCPDYPEDAPAPSEADGALNYLRECVDAMREGRDGDGVFSQKAYELLDELAALRAPAPSEAMAKDLATVTAVCAVGENHPIGCSAREHGVFFCDCGFTDAVTRLNTHPAPARGVTEEEREVMGDIALDGFIDWCDLDPTDENRSASALARQYLALRQKSRTPDAEGGA